MEKEILEESLSDVVDNCTWEAQALFDMLQAGEFNNPVLHDVATIGVLLIHNMQQRLCALCEFIEKSLGTINIQREAQPCFCRPPGEFIGLKFVGSKAMNSILKQKGLDEDIDLEIKLKP